jgi:hypothetical protein
VSTIINEKSTSTGQLPDTLMHRARHLAAENKGAGILGWLTNSFSNVGIGEVTKRLRCDTRDDAVSGKLKVVQARCTVREEKEKHAVVRAR